MRRHTRNRLRTKLRRYFPNLPKGKDCGRLRHEFDEEAGVFTCRHCDREKEQRLFRWAV
jgi:hypothetical protein